MKTNVFLAEDDIDDIAFFTDIISEISSSISVTVAKNGLELMSLIGNGTTTSRLYLLRFKHACQNWF